MIRMVGIRVYIVGMFLLVFNKLIFVLYIPASVYEGIQYLSVLMVFSSLGYLLFVSPKMLGGAKIQLIEGVAENVDYDQVALIFDINNVKCAIVTNKYDCVKNGDEIKAAGSNNNKMMNIQCLYNMRNEKLVKTTLWVYLVSFVFLLVILYLLLFSGFVAVEMDIVNKVVISSTLLFLTVFTLGLSVQKLHSWKLLKNILV